MNTVSKTRWRATARHHHQGHILEQTRLGSLIESVINTAIGFVVSIALSMVVYPLFGHSFTLTQNFWITVIFTVASIARSYAVRRWANARIRRAAQRMAASVS